MLGRRLEARTGRSPPTRLILPAVSLSRISPPRDGEYLHEVTAGSVSTPPCRRRAHRRLAMTSPKVRVT
ncbi:hypothetical protein BRC79_02850 [Halobacteriales archaeon QH_8_67_27]|nr:MAG: hypothetical protein BRC79_02850 [Halobacteriales archaeon QH_8_67_27]